MLPANQDLIGRVEKIVAEHYEKGSSPLLLADLGNRLRSENIWPVKETNGKTQTLRELIEAANSPNLCIVRDTNNPVYVAVATAATKPIVEKSIERRNRLMRAIPNLETLPRSMALAFCVQVESGRKVFLQKNFPFKYVISSGEEIDLEQYVEVDERYRRPGLKILNLTDISASDRLDLQTKVTAWCRDKSIPIETFYSATANKRVNALERLLAAQRPGLAGKIMIPGDIALLLSRQE